MHLPISSRLPHLANFFVEHRQFDCHRTTSTPPIKFLALRELCSNLKVQVVIYRGLTKEVK